MEVFWSSSSSSSASNEAGAKLLLVQVFCGQGVLCRVLLDSSFAMETSEWHVFQAASSKSWPRGRPLPHGLHVVLPFLLDGGSKFELEFCWTALKVKKRLGGVSFWYCLKAGVDEGGKWSLFSGSELRSPWRRDMISNSGCQFHGGWGHIFIVVQKSRLWWFDDKTVFYWQTFWFDLYPA